MKRPRFKRISMRTLLYFGAAVLALQAAFPFFWMISTSLKPPPEVFATPPAFIPDEPTLENYARLFSDTHFLTYFKNSAVVCGWAVLLTMIVSAFGAYSLTRFRYPGREKFAGLILTTYMFAPIMVVIPFFILAKKIGIENTHLALVLSFPSFCLPFTLWMMRAFFMTIPLELEEAAMVDGCSRLGAIARTLIPLSFPALVGAGLYTFLLAWNEFLFAVVLIESWGKRVITIAIYSLLAEFVTEWSMMMAFSVLASAPLVIAFIFLQRYVVQGMTAGAIKS